MMKSIYVVGYITEDFENHEHCTLAAFDNNADAISYYNELEKALCDQNVRFPISNPYRFCELPTFIWENVIYTLDCRGASTFISGPILFKN